MKWGSGVKNWCLASLVGLAATLSHEIMFECQCQKNIVFIFFCDFTSSEETFSHESVKNWRFFLSLHPRRQPFRTKWSSSVKNWGLCAFLWLVRRHPFCTKRGSSVKNWGLLASLALRRQPFPTIRGLSVKSWSLFCEFGFRTQRGSSVKNWGLLASLVGPAATLSHEMKFEC